MGDVFNIFLLSIEIHNGFRLVFSLRKLLIRISFCRRPTQDAHLLTYSFADDGRFFVFVFYTRSTSARVLTESAWRTEYP